MMTPLPPHEDPAHTTSIDHPIIDETLTLLRAAHARDGLEQRVLTRLDHSARVPHPERTGVPGTRSWRAGVGSEGWVPTLITRPPFAQAAFASVAFGAVAVAALGATVFLAYSRPRHVVFVPAAPAPVLSHNTAGNAVQAAGATAVAQTPIHPHTRGRSHRIGRAVHPRTPLPRGATSPRQLDLHAPPPLALQR